jgi:hypothetical protein
MVDEHDEEMKNEEGGQRAFWYQGELEETKKKGKTFFADATTQNKQ